MSLLVFYPTFLVIGAQKCGTSWIGEMVSQHPEVAVARTKEVHFFNNANNIKKGIKWYKDHFSIAPGTKAVGEFSPNYFWTSEDEKEIEESCRTRNIPALVQSILPDLQLIISLRDPVDRAVSAYYHHIRAGRIRPTQGLLEMAGHYGIETMGYYDIHLRKWLEYYPWNRFLILFYEEDLKDDRKTATLNRIFRHIGVDESFKPKGIAQRYNPRYTYLEMHVAHYPRIIKKIIRYFVPHRFKMSRRWEIVVQEEEKVTLRERYRAHNNNLSEMLRRKLPWT
jgi:hypothetical protein